MVEAAEVVVKLGDSIVSVTRVERGSAYWIGTAPGVDLAVRVGVTRWPLVDGAKGSFVVRDPHATGHDQALAPNDVISVPLGNAVAHVMPIVGRVPQLPLRRAEARPWIYGAFVLVLHLLVWRAAEATWRPEKLVDTKQPPRFIHVVHAPPIEEKKPVRPAIQQQRPKTESKGSAKRGRQGEAASTGGDRAPGAPDSGGWGNIGALVSTMDVVGAVNDSVAYDEEAAKANQFGNHGGGFAPCEHMDCSSAKLKHYTVQMTREGAGEYYEVPGEKGVPPRVSITAPTVNGSAKSAEIQQAVAQRDAALQDCLSQFSSQTRGSLRAEIMIDRSGNISINGLKGHNDQRAKDCVADVVRSVQLEGTFVDETTASVQIAFAFPNTK